MELLVNDRKYLKELKALYKDAFPKEERKPFFFIEKLKKEGKCVITQPLKTENLQGLQ